LANEPRPTDETGAAGPRPGVYALLFYCLGVMLALVVRALVRLTPNWDRWWLPVFGVEIVAYLATLFLPPAGRLHIGRATARIATGMGLRLLIAVTGGLLLLVGGEKSDLLEATETFWAGHWAAALASIVVVAVMVYVLRAAAVRGAKAKPPRTIRPPSVPGRMTREELLRQLMTAEPASEATQPLPTPPAPAQPPLRSEPKADLTEPTAEAEEDWEGEGAPAGPPPVAALLVPEASRTPATGEEAEMTQPLPVAKGSAREAGGEATVIGEAVEEPVAQPEETALAEPPRTGDSPPSGSEAERPPPAGQPGAPAASEPMTRDIEALAGEVLRLPAQAVLRALPPAVLSLPIEEAAARVPDGVFSFEWDVILPQLELGEVRAPAQDLLRQVPPSIIAGTPGQFVAALPKDGLILPLSEIVARVPAEVFAPPPGQVVVEVPHDVPAIFQEAPAPGAARATWEASVEAPAPPSLLVAEAVAEGVGLGSLTHGQEVAESARPEGPSRAEEPEPVVPPWVDKALTTKPVEPELPLPPEPAVAAVTEEPRLPLETEESERQEGPPVVEPLAESVALGSPTHAEQELAPEIVAALLGELRALDCQTIDLVSRPGLRVVVAHGSSQHSPQTAEQFAELVERGRQLTREGAAGELVTALVIGTQGAAFVGAANGTPGVYLGVETERGGAGQAAITARKALPLVSAIHAEGTAASGVGTVEELVRDDALGQAAAQAMGVREAAAFRGRGGLLIFVSITPPESGELAALAAGVWETAQRVHPSGVDRLIVLGSERTLGMARAARPDTLVVAGFSQSVNTGLVGAEIGKLAKACNAGVATGGIGADGV